jgi:phosphatidylglycerophosphate synthase
LRQIAYAEKQIISYFRIVGTNKKEVVRIFLGGTAATRWARLNMILQIIALFLIQFFDSLKGLSDF